MPTVHRKMINMPKIIPKKMLEMPKMTPTKMCASVVVVEGEIFRMVLCVFTARDDFGDDGDS